MRRRTWQPAWQSNPNSWSRPCLLIASGFCTALGVGYQAVAIAGWLQYYLLLRFLDRGRRRLRLWVLAWLVHAAGWTLAMAVGYVDADGIASWVNTKAEVNISIYKSPWPVILFSLFFLLLMALVARPLLSFLPTLLVWARNTYLWMFVCAAFYICSISGLVFDIIRHPPLFHAERRRWAT
ncbi:hypothetical protein NSK_007850 [Nannochloropsis salina CCMP1776]|uniref:Uncharacterized protein n=1 Tax=Nannochloropsis salina CCMP1776 TaxID=1027361 RepID=A0A4D9CT18_9STRA|nr:hypothetical protein NSK_007850 [Nannochloropsis salina CCMP1776]|eukprot:TFJ80673.1 hypothetical protein NSK_007850 [Nannochloropsis salina CCMP1776]